MTIDKTTNIYNNSNKEDQVEITYYTDPLCCWSWGFEPQWRRLRYEFDGQIKWGYKMGGMISNWNTFNDPMNAISKPSQMGPLWMEARHTTGMHNVDRIWIQDPPASSYPACIAVKCAEMQSLQAAEVMLRRLREAVMLERKNVAKKEIILEIAERISKETTGLLDLDRFKQDINSEAGTNALREDLQNIKYQNIGRFPTLTFTRPGYRGVMIVGYRPYSVLLDAFKQVAPDLEPTNIFSDVEEYKKFWGNLTEREISEVMQPAKL